MYFLAVSLVFVCSGRSLPRLRRFLEGTPQPMGRRRVDPPDLDGVSERQVWNQLMLGHASIHVWTVDVASNANQWKLKDVDSISHVAFVKFSGGWRCCEML